MYGHNFALFKMLREKLYIKILLWESYLLLTFSNYYKEKF